MPGPLILAAALFATTACAAAPATPTKHEPVSGTAAQPPKGGVYRLKEKLFVPRALEDVRELQRYAAGLERLRAQLEAQRATLQGNEESTYTPEQKRTLLSAWAALHDYVFSVEMLRQRYWGFMQVPQKNRLKHAWGYLITHAALTTELAHGLAFSQWAAGHKQLEVLLDEPSPELGIPRGAFAQLKAKVIHVATTTQLLTGDEYLDSMLPVLDKRKLSAQPEVVWLLAQMRGRSAEAKAILKEQGVELYAGNAFDILKDQTLGAFFPVQKNVAEWMGDTRVKRWGQPLISREQALALSEKLEPGDILVARQNWFLSNVGLPGFWPHGELYVGPAKKLAAYLDEDPEVQGWVAGQSGGERRFSAWLEAKFPEKWKAYLGSDSHGDPIEIIEAISEGVSFTGIGHGMLVDYLGAMRPRLSKLEKAKAIARAFGYQGRPYDFNFDFFSDATLVCTELVYKSYAPSEDAKGLKIGLVDVAGRMTLPANELVKLFDVEYDRPDRQLDFVGFLDGREESRDAAVGSLEDFRNSYKRVKWDVAQR